MKPVWAIRQKSSGFFLPAAKGKGGNGGSYVEPVDPDKEPPRLFMSKKAAHCALVQWLKGHHKASWAYDSDDYGHGYSYVEDIKIIPQPNRNLADMEVVEIELVVFNN